MKKLSKNDVPVSGRSETATGDHFSPRIDEVTNLAHELWERRGRPFGSPEEDWLRAELELKHNRIRGSVA